MPCLHPQVGTIMDFSHRLYREREERMSTGSLDPCPRPNCPRLGVVWHPSEPLPPSSNQSTSVLGDSMEFATSFLPALRHVSGLYAITWISLGPMPIGGLGLRTDTGSDTWTLPGRVREVKEAISDPSWALKLDIVWALG